MDGNKDLVMISRADITILDQEVLGVLWKVRGFKDTDSWGTVGLEWCWGKLWVSEPGEVGSVELDVFGCDRECVVLGVGRIERDLCGLDLADDMKGSIVLAYAERDGQLATASDRVDSEGSVTGGDELGSVRRIPGWSEVNRAFQVCKDADGFGLVALGRG